jgi:transposase
VNALLFVGDDWAQDHHDIEIQDESGRRLAKARLPEGVAGMARLHALLGEHLVDVDTGADGDAMVSRVAVGIETDRGPWVRALVAAGYRVFAVNPLQAARFRQRRSVSGAKSDAADAHTLADMVRTDSHQLRQVAGDSELVEAMKVVARAHKTLIWERTRHVQRLRNTLQEFFPGALAAFEDLTTPDALELLGKAADPITAARLTRTQIIAALRRAGRRHVVDRAEQIKTVLRAEQLTQPPAVAAAYAATVRSQVAILSTLNAEIATMQDEVADYFGQHPAAEIYLSQPGLGIILGARVLSEFGDDPDRYVNAKARKNYAGTSPITRQSGRQRFVLARYVHNDRLVDALGRQAFTALTASPAARAYYDQLRDRGKDHHAALRQLANRLVGILHGCLKTNASYDESAAWPRFYEAAA